MKPGGGKGKGGAFERVICKQLSLWITDGKLEDCLWRSAMSGGRATVAHRKGISVRQAGDICAVAPEGHALTDQWFIECKHVRKLALDQFLIKGTGPLAKFWSKAVAEAIRHERDPMVIAKQNGWPVIVVTKRNHLAHWVQPKLVCYGHEGCDISLYSDLLETKFDD